jgi:hypothetical protein
MADGWTSGLELSEGDPPVGDGAAGVDVDAGAEVDATVPEAVEHETATSSTAASRPTKGLGVTKRIGNSSTGETST